MSDTSELMQTLGEYLSEEGEICVVLLARLGQEIEPCHVPSGDQLIKGDRNMAGDISRLLLPFDL